MDEVIGGGPNLSARPLPFQNEAQFRGLAIGAIGAQGPRRRQNGQDQEKSVSKHAGLLGVVGQGHSASEDFQLLKFYNNCFVRWKSERAIAAALEHSFEWLKGSDFSQRTVDLNPRPGSNTATAVMDARKDMKNG